MPNSLADQLKLFSHFIRKKNFWIILTTDIVLLALAHFLAYEVRFERLLTSAERYQFSTVLPLILLIKIPVFYFFGLYRGMWRYMSTTDVINLIKAALFSFLLVVTCVLSFNRFEGLSRSIFFLDAVFTFLLISGHRFAIRFFYKNVSGSRKLVPVLPLPHKNKKKLLLIGAGDAAEMIVREVRNNPRLPYEIVGLVDDNPNMIGLKIHGIPVLGLVEDLEEHIDRAAAKEVLIAISSGTGKQLKRLVELCRRSGTSYKVLPGLSELIDCQVSIRSMREISYKDFIGREELQLDHLAIGNYLENQVILITGAGGSIGSELCRQIIRFSPKLLILLDAGEENLYTIQMELEHEYGFSTCLPILGKVQDHALLEILFKQQQPSVVFHAAAYKHVPLIELNPWEAIFNNVIATQCLIEAAIVHKVKRFVLVSSDKAVNPTNVMGASKRLTELLMLACAETKWDGSLFRSSQTPPSEHETIFQAVRFVNVIGSSGSVIPLFKHQIELGGPVTVTDPEVTRYFMSIEEAAKLTLQAGAMGLGGEIFILKMGEPIKIDQLARDLIQLSGREPDTEIEIKYTGLRPGEKLYEELITKSEGIEKTNHDKIMVLYGNGITYTALNQHIQPLLESAQKHDDQEIKLALKKLIPEYTPSSSENNQPTE
ncbi:MAG: nucleoside-diphosphate sugar epimerase/dehydratase [Pseudomonadota bacterium]|nr:nucleoside-diphosphate sugar epimerase/dehydratase [Pseudomonadota bacterium]